LFFADRIRNLLPDGFTLSGFIRTRYSRRVQIMYLIELFGLATCSFAVQLLAGGKVVSLLSGIPFLHVTIILAVIALLYSMLSGLEASVVTDYAQMVIILIVGFTLIPWVVNRAGGLTVLSAGLGGRSGEFNNIFSGKGLRTAWTFGIPVTIGLMAGPFGDQSFWQRAFATKQEYVKGAFFRGALIFMLVPLIMSVPGFMAAGKMMDISDEELVNLETVLHFLPVWAMIPFALMLISGLASTLDSNLCSIASIAGHDFIANKRNSAASTNTGMIFFSRLSMIFLAMAALLLANIPGIKILYLFLFYGTLRAATFLPTILSLTTNKVSEKGMFWGILVAVLAGLPLFAFGKFNNHQNIAVLGSILTVLSSGCIARYVK